MAGVADRAFREVCAEFGAAYLVGEMASARGIAMGNRKSMELLSVERVGPPMAVQLFGDDPDSMARAARAALAQRPDIIDINMGCPAPKVAAGGGGAALMRRPELAARIVRAVSDAVAIPVTVKMRKGWDEESVNAVEFARLMERSGAAALTVHGRTRAQMYAPPVDLDVIAEVKAAVSIPVIGNGDIFSAEEAQSMYDRTGCDLVMVGRGALGAPWLFAEIEAWLRYRRRRAPPPVEERMGAMRRHLALLCRYRGMETGLRESRKHAAWYMRGLRGAARLRQMAGQIAAPEDIERLAALAAELNQGGPG
jgi:nifR3 family TIM-barrel protein